MVDGQKVIVVLPDHNAAKTLRQTFAEIDANLVDDIILVDEPSSGNKILKDIVQKTLPDG